MPTQRHAGEDAVEWARRETWAFTIWKCKVYGALVGLTAIPVVLISKGMPLHFMWRWPGIPLLLVFAGLFTAFLFYGAAALGEILDKNKPPPQSFPGSPLQNN